jgi:acyl-coenzyme A synthetase/AMP-(fatty) acid ligase/thioesterase domain-containing protein
LDKVLPTAEAVLSFDDTELTGSIPERFGRVAAQCPEHVAVRSGTRSLTYGELDRLTDRIASALRARLGDAPEAVAIFVTPGADTVIALLGIIKAGKYYCALSPGDPPARLHAILMDLSARLLITDDDLRKAIRQAAPDDCILITLEELHAGTGHPELPELHLEAQSRAGIFFTSGTTGEPKGIPRDHRGMLYRAWLDNHVIGIRPGDRLIMLRGFTFSGSAGDVASTLLNGATLYVHDVRQLGISMLPAYLIREKITIFRPPIELLRYFLDNLEPGDFFPDVRCLVLSGDTLYKRDIERARPHFSGQAVIIHHLSSSEVGIVARLVIGPDTPIDGEIVPVGYPVPGKEILILDESGQKLGPDQAGEIAIRSRSLVAGSGSLPAFMEDQFIPDPDDPSHKVFRTGDLGRLRRDGLLEFIGRGDLQFKIRGYRVNAPAIVSKLMEMDGIRHAIVTARPDASGEKRLIAYLVAAPGKSLSWKSLRAGLAKQLPDYMLPSGFVFVDQIPVSPNGKIDYRALPEPEWSHPEMESESVAPRDDLDRKLIALWQEVLAVEGVGIRDDFFALGGHSLTGASLCARIGKEFGRKLYPAALVENNTVERLADLLKHASLPPKIVIPIQTGGDRTPLFLAPGNEGDTLYFRPLAGHLGADQPVYGLQVTDLGDDLPALTDLETMAAYYLREMRTVQASGPYYLAGHSFGGRLVFAIAHLLVQAGEPVNLLVLMDTFAPGQMPRATLLERIRLHRDNLHALPIREWPAYFRARFNNLIVRLSKIHRLRPLIGRFHLIPADAASKNRIAARGYVYRRYPGKLVFFRVNERPSFVRTDLTAGWREYADEVEVHDVPGDHATLLNEPNVASLAGELSKCLQQARAGLAPNRKTS